MSPFRPGDRVIVLPGCAPAVVVEPDVRIDRANRGVVVRRDSGRVTTVPAHQVLLDPDPDPEPEAA